MPSCSATQELRGLGLANLVGAAFNCYTTTGSFSRSAIMHDVGAKTQLAGIISGAPSLSQDRLVALYRDVLLLFPEVQWMHYTCSLERVPDAARLDRSEAAVLRHSWVRLQQCVTKSHFWCMQASW